MRQKGFRIWLARIVLTILALIILLPMVQTFLYSFSSIGEMKAMRAEAGVRLVLKRPEDAERIRGSFPGMALKDGVIELPELHEKEEGKLFRLLAEEKIPVISFERKEPDLEELFLEAISGKEEKQA